MYCKPQINTSVSTYSISLYDELPEILEILQCPHYNMSPDLGNQPLSQHEIPTLYPVAAPVHIISLKYCKMILKPLKTFLCTSQFHACSCCKSKQLQVNSVLSSAIITHK